MVIDMSDIRDNKKFLIEQLKWIAISLVISLTISIIVPFPYSLVVIIPLFLAISYFVRRRALAKAGIVSGLGIGSSNRPSYFCMSCGNKHSQRECPKCGSKLKKAGW